MHFLQQLLLIIFRISLYGSYGESGRVEILIFQQKQVPWIKVLRQSRDDSREWDVCVKQMETHSAARQIRKGDQQCKDWTRPEAGWYKCNVDGSFINSVSPAQAGWIVRDSMGSFQGATQSIGQKVNNTLKSEFQAVIMAIQYCWPKGYKKIIVEGHCKKIIDIVHNRTLHFEGYNWTHEALRWKPKF